MNETKSASSQSIPAHQSDSQRLEELERALQVAEAARIEAESELEDVARFLSHDLRAPLRGIDGYSKALVEDYGNGLDNMALAYLQYISESGRLAAAVVEKLIHYIRVPRSTIEKQWVNLSEAAQDVLEKLQSHSPERQVKTVIAPDLMTSADSRLARLLVEYLLENSWKFTSKLEQAEIEIGALNTGGETVFFVQDNGAGFNPAYSDQLFKPFQRLHSAHEFEGAGMGLAVARRIVERHGGRIWGQGNVNRGATFFFVLDPNA